MAGSAITINTEEVLSIASSIENDNKQLQDLLNSSKNTIDALQSYWDGPAAEATYAAYAEFAGKFFQNYYDVLDQYVKFLRQNVAENYSIVEQSNTSLADGFR